MSGVGITYLWVSKEFPPFIRLEFEQPTKFEKVLDEFYRDMEDFHCQLIGNIDGADIHAVTVELGYLAHWFDRLQEAYDEEKRTNDN